MKHVKLLLSVVTVFSVLQSSAAIKHGMETYPAGAASLKPVTLTGTVAPPKLMRAEKGVKIKLSGTGGTCGVVKRLGSFQRKGEYVHVATRISNPAPSFVAVEFQLYNATEKRVLVKTAPEVIQSNESPAVNLSLEYRASLQDVGDTLVLCWVQTSTENPHRTFCIEQVEVMGIRPLVVAETFPGGDSARLEPAVFSGEAALPTFVKTTNDADNGDGKRDGAVAVYSAELGGTYGVVWKLGKVEAVDKRLHCETVWYAAGNSNVGLDVQLYNATTEEVLVRSGVINAPNIDAPPTVVAFDYALQAADKNCELEVRWVQTTTDHSSRNFIIDRFSVSESEQ